MPRFDPQYLIESDGLRVREAQHALVNARGHYLGATAAPPSKKDVIKANRQRIQTEINKIVPNLISVNADGTLRLNDPISALDRNIASLMPPVVKSAIDALPSLPAVKSKLKTRPVTFFLDLFDPFLNALRGALEKVMTRGISNTSAGFRNKTTKDTGELDVGGFVYDLSNLPFPGLLNNPKMRNINIWLVQPGDEMFDDNSQRLILRVRMVMAYLVLFFKKPVELQIQMGRALLDLLFGEDVVLVSTQGQEVNKPETALVVDRLPAKATRYGYSDGTNNVYYQVQEPGAGGRGIKTTYYRLSTKGLADRKAALQSDYDRKYAAYVQDFKFWHPDFAARVAWVKNTEGKSESAAVAKVAGEYDLPGRFASEEGVWRDARFGVTAGERLGGPMIAAGFKNGRRAQLKGLGSLGAEPTAVVGAKTATDVTTPVVGPTILEQTVQWVSIITSVLGAITLVINAINAPKLAEEETKQEQIKADAAAAAAESDRLRSQSEDSSNTKIALVVAAGALLAFGIYRRKTTA